MKTNPIVWATALVFSFLTITPALAQRENQPTVPTGQSGQDYSVNPPSISGMTLLETVVTPPGMRHGYFIQVQCVAGARVLMDHPTSGAAPTTVVLSGAAFEGGAGGVMDMGGIPHTGRLRVYSSNATCPVAIRVW